MHVRPCAQGGEHAPVNGLLLRADIHRLCDTVYVTVTPDHDFRVSGDLFDDFHNGLAANATQPAPRYFSVWEFTGQQGKCGPSTQSTPA